MKDFRINLPSFGISGFAGHIPASRVSLKDWCQWTGGDRDKTRAVIGHSFRVAGPQHSVYTLAANAALQPILDHDIDPRRVGYLFALGAYASHSPPARDELAGYAAAAGIPLDEVLREMGSDPQLLPQALQGLLPEEPYPLCARLAEAIDLNQHQYETLHAGHLPEGLPPDERSGVVVSRIGAQQHGPVLDYGIEYHHEQAVRATTPEHDTCTSGSPYR